MDVDFSGPQKIHSTPVPRYGGVGIVLGLLASAGLMWWTWGSLGSQLTLTLLACALPAFLVGLYHDFSDSVQPRWRLTATLVSAAIAFFVLDAAVTRVDIPGLDWLLAFPAVAFVATLIAVAGIANAVNIIDGLNGLAAVCVVIMLAAAAYVAFSVSDPLVGTLALAGIGAVLGFFLWNFPSGLIFLGDGGAYFLGFFVAEVLLLLVVRNPEVSPLFPLLVAIYPVFETVFSIYRRYWLRAKPAAMPDGAHLHSLVYRRVMRWAVGRQTAEALTRRNSMASPYLWLLCSLSVVPAVWFWDSSGWQSVFLLLFCLSYLFLYWRIVRFNSPAWLQLPERKARKPRGRDNRKT